VRVLVGDTRSRSLVARLEQLGWGRIWIASKPTPYPGEPWGFDNGAFIAWRNQQPWDADAYLRLLDRAHSIGAPHLAVVPDKVGDPGSLDFSLSWLERLPSDWPWYLAVQDGMVPGAVDLTPFRGVFLGGTNRYKATARRWCEAAHTAGLPFHYGRAGTPKKLTHAMQSGCDSLDSAFPLWQLARLDEFIRHAQEGPDQLWLGEVA
jgi:hypothetical protein